MKDITVKDISQRLADRASQLVPTLLPGGREVKGEWCCGDIRGGSGDSLKVHLSGEHAGHWMDWANQDDKGDLLDLWSKVQDIPLPEAIKQAKDYLGIQDGMSLVTEKKYEKPKPDTTKPVHAEGKAMQFLTVKRGLKKEIVERYKVAGVPESHAIAFPCYSPRGELVNRSYRTLPVEGKKKEVWQDKGCAPSMFGWHALPKEAWDTRTVLLCEGQIDCMSWAQWGIAALSIPNGSGATWIEHEWDNLAAFDHIYLSCDMDGAGGEIAKKIIQRLGVHRCLIVSIPCKDANECLLAGHGPAEAYEWIRKAKPPIMNGLVMAKDLKQRLYTEIEEKVEPFTLPFFRLGWPDYGFYPHPGDVTIWTGHTGQGKSTFLTFYQIALLSLNQKTFVASMEIKAERTLRKMAMGVSQGKPVTTALADGLLSEIGEHLIFADVVGYIEPKKLLEMMFFAFRRHGCTRFFIDSLMRVKGLEEDYPAQGDFMNELAAFAKDLGVFVDIVCHPRKKESASKVSEMDIKGSSLIANNADNIASIIKNPEKDKLRKDGQLTPDKDRELHDAEIRIDKQREVGWTGLFKLRFDPRTLKFHPMPGHVVKQ